MIRDSVLGSVFLVAGLCAGLETLYSLGFATLIEPDLERGAWWAEYWEKIWSHGLVVLGLLSCILVGLGSRIILSRIDMPLAPHQDDQLGPIIPLRRLKDQNGRDEFF